MPPYSRSNHKPQSIFQTTKAPLKPHKYVAAPPTQCPPHRARQPHTPIPSSPDASPRPKGKEANRLGTHAPRHFGRYICTQPKLSRHHSISITSCEPVRPREGYRGRRWVGDCGCLLFFRESILSSGNESFPGLDLTPRR